MTIKEMTKTTKTTKEVLAERGYTTRANARAGNCDCCGAGLGVGVGRIARPAGGQNWTLLCRTQKCTTTYLADARTPQGDSDEGLRSEHE